MILASKARTLRQFCCLVTRAGPFFLLRYDVGRGESRSTRGGRPEQVSAVCVKAAIAGTGQASRLFQAGVCPEVSKAVSSRSGEP